MNEQEQKAFEDDIYAFVGQVVYPTTPAPDDINETMIRQWSEILGETNPAYLNADWAAASSRGHTIAPPAMMYVWGQEGFQVTKGRAPNAMSTLVETFNRHGFTGVLDLLGGQTRCNRLLMELDKLLLRAYGKYYLRHT